MKKSRIHIFALALACTLALVGVMAPSFALGLHHAASFAVSLMAPVFFLALNQVATLSGPENLAMLSLAGTVLATSGAQAVAGFDLDTIEDASQADVELRHPKTDMGTGAFITLMGPEHPERKAITLGLMRRARAEAMRSNTQPKDPEEDIAESIGLMTSITVGWRGISRNGQPLAFSKAAATALYNDPKSQWIVKQLTRDMNKTALFIKA